MTVAAKSTGTAVRKPARSEPFRRAEATAGASSPLRIAEERPTSRGGVASPSRGPVPSRTPGPVATRCQGLGYRIAKRALDLPVTLVLTVLALPVMAVVALTIYITSPGPALFRQQRLGRDGKPFPCLKFRSMRTDAEKVLMSDPDLYERYRQNGYKLPAEEDPRIHPVGAFLRRTSLDELPQLFNVLAGHMSLVGPRPIVPAELEEYGEGGDSFLSAYPGITGWWQVSGRSQLPYPERAFLELEYVERWSPLLDLRILSQTVPAVLARRGAH